MEGTLASCRQDIPELGVCKVSQAFTGTSAFLGTCYFVHGLKIFGCADERAGVDSVNVGLAIVVEAVCGKGRDGGGERGGGGDAVETLDDFDII